MHKLVFTSLLCIMSAITSVMGQKPTQTIRGIILDSDSKLPLAGVSVVIAAVSAGEAITGQDGSFRLEKVEVGKITLQLSCIGYDSQSIPDIDVSSGKEVVLNLNMQESVSELTEVVITAKKNKGEALNEMSLISSRSISLEETKRYAGSYNDPSRILTAFAGVGNSQNGDNDIIVRGNSPKYVQWRLEGVEITNPNHFADQNSVSGGISALNNNLLATSDFYTGAFSPEFGDVLSGVYDVKLRNGNNEKFESALGVGILGTDLMVEGPFKKGYGGSYLANYRYSTISVLDKLGLLDVGGVPVFQDAAFKVMLPTKNKGNFSLFGLGGLSSFLFKNVQPQIWETPGDRSQRDDISEDYSKKNFLLNSGINHTLTVNKKGFVTTSISYAANGASDDVYETKIRRGYDSQGAPKDSVISKMGNFKSRLVKSTYRASLTYHHKINAKNKIEIGIKYGLFDYDFTQSHLRDSSAGRFTAVDFKENISTLRNFVSWKHRFNSQLTLVAGLHNMNVLYNGKSTLEPRVAIKWQLNLTNAISAGYGKHSNMESIHNYFARVAQQNGSVAQPNKDLDLLKAHHFVIGYEKRFTEKLMAKVEVYYQYLYNLPVENYDTSSYATINENLELRYVELVNKGTGKNYGIEMTVERFLKNNFYFLINGSLFESKYKSLENIERNTQFNGNYLCNVLFGKEFVNLGKKKNQSLSLNVKLFYGGGKRYMPLLRDEGGNLAVDPANGRFWDYKKAYEKKLDDIFSATVSVSYKFHRKKTTHEIYLNIDNVTNNLSRITEYYDESKPNSIGYVTQFGFFPNLMYRVYL